MGGEINGAKLRQHRHDQGLSQRELSERTSGPDRVSADTIYRIERVGDETYKAHPRVYRAMTSALGLKPGDLR